MPRSLEAVAPPKNRTLTDFSHHSRSFERTSGIESALEMPAIGVFWNVWMWLRNPESRIGLGHHGDGSDVAQTQRIPDEVSTPSTVGIGGLLDL